MRVAGWLGDGIGEVGEVGGGSRWDGWRFVGTGVPPVRPAMSNFNQGEAGVLRVRENLT